MKYRWSLYKNDFVFLTKSNIEHVALVAITETTILSSFSALLAICAGNSPIIGEFPAQRPVTRSFDVFFDLRLNKRLSKQSRGWWFETPPTPLWRHSNGLQMSCRDYKVATPMTAWRHVPLYLIDNVSAPTFNVPKTTGYYVLWHHHISIVTIVFIFMLCPRAFLGMKL